MTRYSGPIVDVDIHHRYKTDAEVFRYLPKRWRTYAEGAGVAPQTVRPPGTTTASMLGNGARRVDAFPADGTFAGSDYDLLREQLLDRYAYYRGILTHDQGEYGQHPNLYFGIELCKATNEWNMETWLTVDERLYSLVAIPTAAPDEAAKEIRRVGKHPRIVGVLMAGNGFGKPYGDPVYHPIYEAAAEMGLSIAVHLALNRPNSQITAVGGPA